MTGQPKDSLSTFNPVIGTASSSCSLPDEPKWAKDK
jgi:hypothetical protein